MVATWRLYAHLVFEIPLLFIYILLVISCFGDDPNGNMNTSFYTFILFGGILDIFTYFVTLFTYRLPIYMPFIDFFGDMEGSKNTFIYAFTWYLCAAREYSMLALALNRFTALIYNNKKWSGRSMVLSVLLCLICGFVFNYYMFDTDVEYQKIPMGDGTSIYFMIPDEFRREWLSEPVVTLSWASFSYCMTMAIYILLAFHIIFGGVHPDVDRREFRLTMIAFMMHCCNTGFYINQIMSYLIDRDDILEALRAVREGAPIIPFAHDLRSLCVPAFIFLFDSVMRVRILSIIGMGGGSG